MNRRISTTAAGTAVAVAALFHGGRAGTPNTAPSQAMQSASAPAASAKARAVDDGPWIASCAYWSAARSGTPDTSPSGCGPHAWGIPSGSQITAVIATVPDPIHSHLALDFDRSIDAILQAAAESHYLSTRYWLPWRSQIESSAQLAPSATKPTAEDDAREQQPGLLVLRYEPNGGDAQTPEQPESLPTDYRRVVYLFLVAETPALGVNGNQLQNAFTYEKMLSNKWGARLSVSDRAVQDSSSTAASSPPILQRDAKGAAQKSVEKPSCSKSQPVSIIGPIFSGSAASLSAGIEAAFGRCLFNVSVNGITGTQVAADEMTANCNVTYRSFGQNVAYEQKRFLESLTNSGYDLSRVALLSEAGTLFGAAGSPPVSEGDLAKKGTILSLRFPRELSLLRNAEPSQSANTSSTQAPTPYLNLSLKDYSSDDTVPRFSTVQSPLSIEAQLMAIAEQIVRARIQFIVVSASNELDVLFLVQFLHRACPDARLVVMNGGDLLLERDTENSSYIGAISLSPYLLSSLNFGNRVQYLFADDQAEEIYNAAIFTFHGPFSKSPPPLAGYRNYPIPDRTFDRNNPAPAVQFQQIPLWATVVGADGYYPLAILSWCASDSSVILPTIFVDSGQPLATKPCSETNTTTPSAGASTRQLVSDHVPESINENSGILPSLPWDLLAALISFTCVAHCIFLVGADFWSPLTRDLAIDQNDSPHRRAVHLNIGTSVLSAIAFATGYPLLRVGHYFHLAPGSYPLAVFLLGGASLAIVCTLVKTWPYRSDKSQPLYAFFNLVSAAALAGTVMFWTLICRSDHGRYTYAGLYFCFRCLRPFNRVCPLLPILLLLLAWYLWSIFQTARLRFSAIHRPRIARLGLPRPPYHPSDNAYDLFVADDTLESCGRFNDFCLYQNIMSLLISKEVICRLCSKLMTEPSRSTRRLAAFLRRHINLVLGAFYCILFILYIYVGNVRSLDHFLFLPLLSLLPSRAAGGPTLYEFLIAALFFPLIMVALSGWLRVILIWGSLSRGALEPLERMPIRFAFSRFDEGGWFSMLRQKGLHVRWRDMSRSTESIRQLVRHPYLDTHDTLKTKLREQYEVLNYRLHGLLQKVSAAGKSLPTALHADAPPSEDQSTSAETSVQASNDTLRAVADKATQLEGPCPSPDLHDLPGNHEQLCDIFHIEQAYARFCTVLIQEYLAGYWDKERKGFVDDASLRDRRDEKASQQAPVDPTFPQLAEELIVIRYVALIRAVLINIRYLMLFVSTAFVLAMIGWNSYPFQPHAFIDQCFTILLLILTFGFVWVFAQMHRNAILSRITNTNANELGWEFYLRLAAFGAVPFLTWFAYQFPDIGGSIYRVIQPGLQALK